eukprot:12880150-Prorocentrum_lima.AAC.1
MFCETCGRIACDVCCASFALVNDQVMTVPAPTADETGELRGCKEVAADSQIKSGVEVLEAGPPQ